MSHTMAESLRWANVSIERIDRALRQLERLQASYEAEMAEMDRLTKGGKQPPRPMPKSWTDLNAQFEDDLYFFVIAARQALKAVWVLEQRGEFMPAFRQQEKLRSWRDLEEHWDEPARGKPLRALTAWQNSSPDHQEPGHSYGSGPSGRLSDVSGVRIKKLRKDLKRARKAAGEVSIREWEHCYITPDSAADLLGITVAELEVLPAPPMHMDFGSGLGVRYWREWVEARRDGIAVPPGWPTANEFLDTY